MAEDRRTRIAIASPAFEARRLRLQPHRTLLEMGRQLTTAGNQVVLISDGAEHLPPQDQVMGLPVRRVGSVHLFQGRRNAPLMAVIEQEAPDLMLWHLGFSSLLHQDLNRSFSQPVIGILTSPAHHLRDILRLGPKYLSSNPRMILVHLLGALAPGTLIRKAFGAGGLTGMITLSEATRQYLIGKGAPADRTWVVPPGVDRAWLDARANDEGRQQVRSQLGFATNDFVVTYFGSPAPVRGVNTILRAVQEAGKAYPQLRLLILSRRWADQWTKQAARLDDLVSTDGLKDRVGLLDGFLTPEELARYVSASNAVCLPFELLPSDVPLSILEGMALGQGVISTNVASIPELLAADRGFLVPPGNASALATQLREIAETPSLARARGQLARAYVERERTWTRMGAVLQQTLNQAQAS